VAAALREVVAPSALTRALLLAVALLAAATLPHQTKYCAERDPSSIPVLNVLTRWDAVAYLWIARDGYSAGTADTPPTTAYSPLLPALMRVLAALARPFGVLLIVPLAIERWRAHRGGQRLGPDALAVAAPALAFAGWQAYLYAVTGDPLRALTAQEAYLRRPTAPWEAVAALFDQRAYGEPWSVLAPLGLIAALVVVSWRALSPSLAAYPTATLVLARSTGTLLSFPRYALAILPAFPVLGAAGRHRGVHYAYPPVATLLAALFTAKHATWRWVA